MTLPRRSRGALEVLALVVPPLALPFVIRPLAAQHTEITGSLDLGVASVTYDDFLRAVVGTLTPSLRVERGRVMFSARGAFSRFEGGNQSLEGTIAAAAISPARWNVRGELFGTASSTRYSQLGDAATNVLVVGRGHWAGPRQGLWLGTGFGAVAQGFFFPNRLAQIDAGGWMRAGDGTFTLQVLPTRIGSLKYVDAVAGARWEPGRGEVVASAGVRGGRSIPGANQWAELGATYWVSSNVAFVGGIGLFPSELWRGLPGGRYASTALRFATRAPRRYDPQRMADLTLPYELDRLRRPRALAQRFSIATDQDGTRTLQLLVPGAGRVELMADFTDWSPTPLTPIGKDRWTFNVFISPGVHRVNIRIDGGPWLAPPGLTVVRDEFGGQVGLLVVQ